MSARKKPLPLTSFKRGDLATIATSVGYLRGQAKQAQDRQERVVIARIKQRSRNEAVFAICDSSSPELPQFQVPVEALVLSTPTPARRRNSHSLWVDTMVSKFQCEESDLFATPDEGFLFLAKQLLCDVKSTFYDPTPLTLDGPAGPNALTIHWTAKDVFLNPPSSQSTVFIDKLITEIQLGNVERCVVILPAEKFFGGGTFGIKLSEWQTVTKWTVLSSNHTISGATFKFLKWRGVTGGAGPRFGTVFLVIEKGSGEAFSPATASAAEYVRSLRTGMGPPKRSSPLRFMKTQPPLLDADEGASIKRELYLERSPLKRVDPFVFLEGVMSPRRPSPSPEPEPEPEPEPLAGYISLDTSFEPEPEIIAGYIPRQ